VNPRAASGGGALFHTPPLFQQCSRPQKSSSTLFLQILEGFGFFWGLFCNFVEMYLIYFEFLL
jgi:hypothetical protein